MPKIIITGIPRSQRGFVENIAKKIGLEPNEDLVFDVSGNYLEKRDSSAILSEGDVLFECNGEGVRGSVVEEEGEVTAVSAKLPMMPTPEDVKLFQRDMFLVKVILYGVGNRHTGYKESIRVKDKESGEEFVIGEREEDEDIVGLYNEMLGIEKEE